MRWKTSLRWWLVLLFMFLLPTIAWAESGLTIEGVELPKEGSKAEEAKIEVYFDIRSGETPIKGVKPENCSITIEDKTPEIVDAEIVDFKRGSHGVGILFVFPKAKAYTEDTFAIRQNLHSLIQNIDRKDDMLNAIPYDNGATTLGWSNGQSGTLAKQISQEVENSEVLEPNLFVTFSTAFLSLDNLQGVSKKYIVIISDAEGAIVGEPEKARRLINAFADKLKKASITPIVIAYSPDGDAGMSNAELIHAIANNANGYYIKAKSLSEFQSAMGTVLSYIFDRNILRATLNMDGDNYLGVGNYPLQLTLNLNDSEPYKASIKVKWPELSKNRTALWVTLISVFVVIGAAVVVIAIKRNRDDDEEEVVEQAPQEVCCATCGKPIPQQLYGFNGEFCLSGGLPDCPYYQMPDRGKIQITRGVLADTTFFIKKDLTTIGSYPENDIYLNDKTVSRKHAAIKTDEGKRYEIRDFGSSNGLYINDERIERKFLRDGDRIRFGTVETVFKLK